MAIWIHVNIRSSVPIYVQLIEQIQHALEVGTLSPGDALPSVRELASELSSKAARGVAREFAYSGP